MNLTDQEIKRFHLKCKKDDNSECIIYQGAGGRYGVYSVRRGNKTVSKSAHRLSLNLFSNIDPPDKVCCHSISCVSTFCVNPLHLRWDTQQANRNDSILQNLTAKGEMNGGSKLTNDQVKEIFNSNEPAHVFASKYNVHPETIRRIRKRTLWKSVTEGL